jgi:hypothetical protein
MTMQDTLSSSIKIHFDTGFDECVDPRKSHTMFSEYSLRSLLTNSLVSSGLNDEQNQLEINEKPSLYRSAD